MKKDSVKNNLKEEEKIEEQNQKNMEYNKLNQILTPLYEHINNLQSQVKELNQKKREDEINIEIDDLIIKDQKNFKPKHIPFSKPREKSSESEKSNKMMMKTLSSLKGTMSNLSLEMRKIGDTFNEKMQKVYEDTEKNKLKKMIGVRPNSTLSNKRISLKNKNVNKEPSNNINIIRDNIIENESILTNKLDDIDYNSFKSDLIDIGNLEEQIINDYKASAPEFIELKKPKTKIKFSYNLDSELNKIDKKINNKKNIKPQQNINIKESKPIKDSKISEKVSNIVNKEKKPKSSPKINNNKEKEKEDIKANSNSKNKIYINYMNQEKENEEHEKKMKELDGLSVVERMNLYKEKMSEQAKKIKEGEKKYQPNNNYNNENNNPLNEIGSNHSGVTFQKFKKPSSQNPKEKQTIPIKFNPPKVEYGIFGEKNEENNNNNINGSRIRNEIINPKIVLPEPEKINNMIKSTIDNYLAAAFSNLKPSEAPKLNINNENNIKSPQKNEVQRVFEKEYIIKKIKEVEDIPKKEVINQPSQSQNIEQNNKLIEKFTNLAEKFTNLEEKISKQIYEEKKDINKKIEIIEKKEKEPINIQPSSPKKQLILPDTDKISKLVMDKIKSKMNIDLNNVNKSDKKKKPKKKTKKVEVKPKEEEKKEIQINPLDINKNVEMEELDNIIRMPHKINLAEYEVSQTSSYLSESLQNNNFNFNNNNQINIKKVNINIEENEYNSLNDETKIDNNNNINNSRSNGEIESNNENSSQNNDIINNNINNININQIQNNNINSKNGIDLLTIKNANEQLQNNINILDNIPNQNMMNNNNINKFQDFMNYVNNNENLNNINTKTNLNIFNNDDFFNDSGENQ